MTPNSSTPLLPANTVAFPASNTVETPEPTEEPTAPEETPEEPTEEPTEETEEPAPAAPAEATAAPAAKLSAFDRGALRMLGKGDLIARLESAEHSAATATAEVTRLTAENLRLSASLAETPAKLEAAAQLRQGAVAKTVAAELSALGITAEAAPSQISESETAKTISRAEFEKLDHTGRNEFFRNGGHITA